MKRFIVPLVFVLAAGVLFQTQARAEITMKNITFVPYVDFPTMHSTWGSIGYSPTYKKVYIGVTDHRGLVSIQEYDPAAKKMVNRGFIPNLANLRHYQWQGKIHSNIYEGPDHAIYFSTDGGESREEYYMNHPEGYSGGFFFRFEPDTGVLRNIGRGLQYESIKDIAIDQNTGVMMGISYPQVHLLVYDWKKNDLKDFGRVGSDHVPRVLWNDLYGNLYYVDWRQRLIKYEPDTGEMLFAQDSLPAFDGTSPGKLITGVTAYDIEESTGDIYLVTYGSMLVKFTPAKHGMGTWKALGGLFDGNKAPHSYYCPNLCQGPDGLLYYFIGGHRQYAIEGKESVVLLQFDPNTGKKKIILEFPLTEISEVTGNGVVDEEGNMYFAGRYEVSSAEAMGESGASKPRMIIFNPLKDVK